MTSEFLVTPDAMRPASNAQACFYCQQPVGGHHLTTCVLVVKRVKVRMIVEYEVEVPSTWDKYAVEFHRNEGSWCSSNILHELEELDSQKGCLCRATTFEFLEDASGPFLHER